MTLTASDGYRITPPHWSVFVPHEHHEIEESADFLDLDDDQLLARIRSMRDELQRTRDDAYWSRLIVYAQHERGLDVRPHAGRRRVDDDGNEFFVLSKAAKRAVSIASARDAVGGYDFGRHTAVHASIADDAARPPTPVADAKGATLLALVKQARLKALDLDKIECAEPKKTARRSVKMTRREAQFRKPNQDGTPSDELADDVGPLVRTLLKPGSSAHTLPPYTALSEGSRFSPWSEHDIVRARLHCASLGLLKTRNEHEDVRTFVLNLSPEIEESAIRARRGAVAFMRDRLERAFKHAGLPAPDYWFILEVAPEDRARLHMNGVIRFHKRDRAAVAEALRCVGGHWKAKGLARQLRFGALTGNNGKGRVFTPIMWTRYCVKAKERDLAYPRTKLRLGGIVPYAMSNSVRVLAQKMYTDIRGINLAGKRKKTPPRPRRIASVKPVAGHATWSEKMPAWAQERFYGGEATPEAGDASTASASPANGTSNKVPISVRAMRGQADSRHEEVAQRIEEQKQAAGFTAPEPEVRGLLAEDGDAGQPRRHAPPSDFNPDDLWL